MTSTYEEKRIFFNGSRRIFLSDIFKFPRKKMSTSNQTISGTLVSNINNASFNFQFALVKNGNNYTLFQRSTNSNGQFVWTQVTGISGTITFIVTSADSSTGVANATRIVLSNPSSTSTSTSSSSSTPSSSVGALSFVIGSGTTSTTTSTSGSTVSNRFNAVVDCNCCALSNNINPSGFQLGITGSGHYSSIDVCTAGAIRGLASDIFMVSSSGIFPFEMSNNTTSDLFFYNIPGGALRFGQLKSTDTALLGIGSLAFGHDVNGFIFALGSGSEAHGFVDNTSTIRTALPPTVGLLSSANVGATQNQCNCPPGTGGVGSANPTVPCQTVVSSDDISNFFITSSTGTQFLNGFGAKAYGYSNQSGLIESSGAGSTAAGFSCGGSIKALSDGSIAIGVAKCSESLTACGIGSQAFGRNNQATAPYSHAIGKNSWAYAYGSFAQSSFFSSATNTNLTLPSPCQNTTTSTVGASEYIQFVTEGITTCQPGVVCTNGSSGFLLTTTLGLGNSSGAQVVLPFLPFPGTASVEVDLVSPPVFGVLPDGSQVPVAGAFAAKYCFVVNAALPVFNPMGQGTLTYSAAGNISSSGFLVPYCSSLLPPSGVSACAPLQDPPLFQLITVNNPTASGGSSFCPGFSLQMRECIPRLVGPFTGCSVNGSFQNPRILNYCTIPASGDCTCIITRKVTATFKMTLSAAIPHIVQCCSLGVTPSGCTLFIPNCGTTCIVPCQSSTTTTSSTSSTSSESTSSDSVLTGTVISSGGCTSCQST